MLADLKKSHDISNYYDGIAWFFLLLCGVAACVVFYSSVVYMCYVFKMEFELQIVAMCIRTCLPYCIYYTHVVICV
jgi:ABC-type siderophore export system fused ATPase/permease subunit